MLTDTQLEKLFETRAYDRPRTKTMRNFLKREAPHRVVGLSIEPDGVFIYTDSEKWSDDSGAGTFREDSETEAIKYFRSMVQPSILGNPKKRRKKKMRRKKNPVSFKSGDVLKNGATVIDFDPISRIVLANWISDGKFVTWQVDPQGATYWGHYFSTFDHAATDYKKRTGQRKKNPDYGDRWIIVGGEFYEVMFLGDGWHVTHVKKGIGTSVFNAGKGDGGFNAAMSHLKGMKKAGSKKNPVRKKNCSRKKNPNYSTEAYELGLYADNLGPSSQREYEKRVYEIRQDFLNNVRKNNPRVWTKKRLMNLTKHAAHMGARAYSADFGSGAFRYKEIFSDANINSAAKYLYESWLEEAEAKYKPNPKKKNPVGAVKPKGFIVASFAPIYNDVVYALDSNGARMDFRKANAKLWKTQKGAGAAAVKIANGWGEPVIVAPVNTSVKQIESYFPGVNKRGKGKRSRNPVGPTQREVDSAGELFRAFTGDHPERMKNVKLPVPKTGLVIGELDGVLYTTVRDGKTEAYQHDFKKGSRPLLASSHDGKSLHVLGGEYEFTERGIEDK